MFCWDIYMNTWNEGFPLEYCAVAMINVIHFICECGSVVFMFWLLGVIYAMYCHNVCHENPTCGSVSFSRC